MTLDQLLYDYLQHYEYAKSKGDEREAAEYWSRFYDVTHLSSLKCEDKAQLDRVNRILGDWAN